MNCGAPYNNVFLSSTMSSASTSPVPSIDEFSMDMENSPKRTRVVSVCHNCSMTFRVNCKSIGDFCSKDCRTTYTIFGRNASYRTPEKSVAEIRSAIYQFQKNLDDEYSLPSDLSDAVAPTTSNVETTLEYKPTSNGMTTPIKKSNSSIFGNMFSSRRSQQNLTT